MPTARPRHQVTETEEVARALDRAGLRWPGEPRAKLLLRLVAEGERAIAEATAATQRIAALDALGDRYAGVYGVGYLEGLREDWPE